MLGLFGGFWVERILSGQRKMYGLYRRSVISKELLDYGQRILHLALDSHYCHNTVRTAVQHSRPDCRRPRQSQRSISVRIQSATK